MSHQVHIHVRGRAMAEKEYEEARKFVEVFTAAGQAFADMGSQMRYGSPSIQTWEKRCQDSLRRSRARRMRAIAEEETVGWRIGYWLMWLLVIVMVALVAGYVVNAL